MKQREAYKKLAAYVKSKGWTSAQIGGTTLAQAIAVLPDLTANQESSLTKYFDKIKTLLASDAKYRENRATLLGILAKLTPKEKQWINNHVELWNLDIGDLLA